MHQFLCFCSTFDLLWIFGDYTCCFSKKKKHNQKCNKYTTHILHASHIFLVTTILNIVIYILDTTVLPVRIVFMNGSVDISLIIGQL